MPTGTKTFDIFSQQFNCNTVAKLNDCNSSDSYYVSESLSFGGSPLVTGDTFSAKITTPDGVKYLCLYYESDVDGSSNTYIDTIYETATDCSSCTPPVPPTPTPTNTPTISLTPSVTPSSISSNVIEINWNWNYDCPACELNGPSATIYTQPSVTSLGSGAVIYVDSALTIYFAPGRYVTDGNDVFSVGPAGVLTLECAVGMGC